MKEIKENTCYIKRSFDGGIDLQIFYDINISSRAEPSYTSDRYCIDGDCQCIYYEGASFCNMTPNAEIWEKEVSKEDYQYIIGLINNAKKETKKLLEQRSVVKKDSIKVGDNILLHYPKDKKKGWYEHYIVLKVLQITEDPVRERPSTIEAKCCLNLDPYWFFSNGNKEEYDANDPDFNKAKLVSDSALSKAQSILHSCSSKIIDYGNSLLQD